MRICSDASLSWHWSAGVSVTGAYDSYCVAKACMLIKSACTIFIISAASYLTDKG